MLCFHSHGILRLEIMKVLLAFDANWYRSRPVKSNLHSTHLISLTLIVAYNCYLCGPKIAFKYSLPVNRRVGAINNPSLFPSCCKKSPAHTHVLIQFLFSIVSPNKINRACSLNVFFYPSAQVFSRPLFLCHY